MSIATRSVFYYGHAIDGTNLYLDFDEGGAELTATLDIGEYTLTEFAAEIKRAMEAVGALTYTVSVNRSTRVITISAASNFTLRTASGSHSGLSAYSLVGFSGSNKTGANTYTASAASGSAYTPQFTLQDYVPPGNFSKPQFSTVVETVNGDVEAVVFSVLNMIEMNIRFCTNVPQGSRSPITNNASGLSNINTFMRYLITKSPVEFVPDSSSPSTYYKVILDTTTEDKNGVGYRLKERVDLMIPGYYDTEKMTFRVLE